MRDVTKIVIAAAVFITGGGMAGAQTAPPKGSVASDTELETIVVTAQKRAEDIQSVGSSIQAFTGKALEELGIKSTNDIAQFAPNVEIAMPSGAGNQPLISIRGIGLNDYDTNNAGPNGVYLDEVYLSTPSSQTFSTFDLQSVEVLKGPQGTLYGRNTDGGAINLVTVKPSDEYSANVHAEYGTYNTSNLEGAIGGQIVSNLDGRFAFDINRSGGYVHNLLTGENENGFGTYAARGMLLYKPLDSLSVLFNVHGGQVDNRPTEYRHLGDLDPTTLGPNPKQCSPSATSAGQCVDFFGYGTPASFYDGAYNRQQHLRVTNAGGYVRIDYDTGAVNLTSISAVEYNNKLHPEDSDASPNRLLEINFGVHSTTVSQEFRAAQNRDKYNWVGGLYYLHENLAQNQPLFFGLDGDSVFGAPGAFDGVAFRAFDTSEQKTDAYAGFGQGEYLFTDWVKLILGARVSKEHKSFLYNGSIQPQEGGEDNFGPVIPLVPPTSEYLDSGNFSWKAALNFNITKDVMTYISATTGFKSGDFNGSFLSTDPIEINRQLVPVRPEKVKAYEVGLKSSWLDRRVIANIAAFYNDYRDMQVFILIPSPDPAGFSINVLDNAPKTHTMGIDFDLTAKLTQHLTLALQGGILQAKIDQFKSARSEALLDYSGNQLPVAPHGSANILLDYKRPLAAGTLDVQANGNYKSHVFFDVSNDAYIQQGGYWLFNARAAYGIGHWEMGAFVHNIANQQYYNDMFDLTVPFGLIQGIRGTPRMAGVEASWRF